jgi:hypothetical protein
MGISDMNKIIPWTVTLAISGFALMMAVNRFPSYKSSPKLQSPTDSVRQMQISSFSYRSRKNGLVLTKLQADDFIVIPKKFFVFQVASVNEAIMTNAKISIYRDSTYGESKCNKVKADEDSIGSFFKEFMAKGGEAGLISNVTVNGIEMALYDSSGILKYHLKASKAELRIGGGGTMFYDAALAQPFTRKQIKADRLFWDSRERKFRRL